MNRGLLGAAVTALVLVTFVPALAHAADEIEFSHDGVTWSSTLSDPLFDPARRWVPGDTHSASLWVRNLGPTAASVTIDVRSADPDELLSRDDIALSARAAGGAWVDLDNGAPRRLLTAMATGGDVRIDIEARFDPDSPNRSQRASASLDFTVTLSQIDPDAPDPDPDDPDDPDRPPGDPEPPGEPPRSGDPTDSPGLLPKTGASVTVGSLLIGAVLMFIGAALIRRREESDGA